MKILSAMLLASVVTCSVTIGMASVVHEEDTYQACDKLIIDMTSTYTDGKVWATINGKAPATLIMEFEEPTSAVVKCVVGVD